MNKLAHRTTRVALDKRRHTPATFRWRGKLYRVSAVQECWRLVGKWWDGEGERTFFRVLAESGGVFEICYDHGRQNWMLERVED
jgi:hypothetical protein